MRAGRSQVKTITLFFLGALVVAVAAMVGYGQLARHRAIELVVAAQEARRELPSKGTVVTRAYTPAGFIQSRAEIHRGSGRAVIRYLDGPLGGTELVQMNGSVWFRGGGRRGMRAMQVGEDPPSVDRDLLRQHYVVRILGATRVAERPALHVAVRRGRGGGLDLWVDQQTHFPLRTVAIATDGRAISDTRYETIRFDVEPPVPQAPPPSEQGPSVTIEATDQRALQKAVGFELMAPRYIPPGFKEQGSYLHRLRQGTRLAAELRYTDGLSPLSIIQMQAGRPGRANGQGRGLNGQRDGRGAGEHGGRGRGQGDASHPPGTPRRFERAVGPLGNVVTAQKGGINIVVTGALPREELEKIAEGME